MSAPSFPLHPHAGLSAVSYVFLDAETGVANRDSLGKDNLIRPGGLHWMAASSRIVHEEVPAASGKTVHSLQIFVAMPPALLGTAPFSLSLEALRLPIYPATPAAQTIMLQAADGGAKVMLLAGQPLAAAQA
jgi:redox-sensitive bicupin YhaK (pirin superfamily)